MRTAEAVEVLGGVREKLQDEDRELYDAALTRLSDFLSENAEYAKSVMDIGMVSSNLDRLAAELWRIL